MSASIKGIKCASAAKTVSFINVFNGCSSRYFFYTYKYIRLSDFIKFFPDTINYLQEIRRLNIQFKRKRFLVNADASDGSIGK